MSINLLDAGYIEIINTKVTEGKGAMSMKHSTSQQLKNHLHILERIHLTNTVVLLASILYQTLNIDIKYLAAL